MWVNGAAAAQVQLPDTDIFVAEIRWRDGRPIVSKPANATSRPGYDNQPSFTLDGQGILYTSIGADNQANILRYDLATKSSRPFIQTVEGEYSASIMPDGKSLCVVRVEMDSTQRLWKFDSTGSNPRLLFPALKPVGYYAWGSDYRAAVFVLGSPPVLQLADVRSGSAEIVERGIGRCIQKVPGETSVSFVHKRSESEWWIVRLDVETGTKTPIIQTMKNVEDYCWLPDSSIVCGSGSKLFRWKAGSEWEEVADFSSAGVTNITRLAVDPSGQRIAIVAIPQKEK